MKTVKILMGFLLVWGLLVVACNMLTSGPAQVAAPPLSSGPMVVVITQPAPTRDAPALAVDQTQSLVNEAEAARIQAETQWIQRKVEMVDDAETILKFGVVGLFLKDNWVLLLAGLAFFVMIFWLLGVIFGAKRGSSHHHYH